MNTHLYKHFTQKIALAIIYLTAFSSISASMAQPKNLKKSASMPNMKIVTKSQEDDSFVLLEADEIPMQELLAQPSTLSRLQGSFVDLASAALQNPSVRLTAQQYKALANEAGVKVSQAAQHTQEHVFPALYDLAKHIIKNTLSATKQELTPSDSLIHYYNEGSNPQSSSSTLSSSSSSSSSASTSSLLQWLPIWKKSDNGAGTRGDLGYPDNDQS